MYITYVSHVDKYVCIIYIFTHNIFGFAYFKTLLKNVIILHGKADY